MRARFKAQLSAALIAGIVSAAAATSASNAAPAADEAFVAPQPLVRLSGEQDTWLVRARWVLTGQDPQLQPASTWPRLLLDQLARLDGVTVSNITPLPGVNDGWTAQADVTRTAPAFVTEQLLSRDGTPLLRGWPDQPGRWELVVRTDRHGLAITATRR